MNPTFLVVDLFCGFGGTTTGFASAMLNGSNVAKVIACINHDAKAIESHWQNHQDVIHFEEDIRKLNVTPLKNIVQIAQKQYHSAYLILWASLECTNFSKAKGGQPRNADSRILAEHLYRYIQALNPDYIMIENVVEFMSWGPLDENGKPISKLNGQDFTNWKDTVNSFGYYDKWTQLNSADFGAYTSRNRLFGCFAKYGLPIVFPTHTHSKKATKNLFNDLKPWKSVKDCLNFEDKGQSIFGRKKNLSEKTLQRIYAGLVKFVAGGNTQFLLKYNSTNGSTGVHIPPGINQPCPTISTQGRLALVQTQFLSQYYGNGFNTSVNTAAPTLTTKDRCSLVEAKHFLLNPQFNNAGSSIDKPCFTLIAKMDKRPPYLVEATNGNVAIEVYKNDTPMAVKIKEFMAAYGIIDITMRMLRVAELLQIQGFPKDYKMIGTQADQKKFIGNSVVPIVVKCWAEALAMELENVKIKIA